MAATVPWNLYWGRRQHRKQIRRWHKKEMQKIRERVAELERTPPPPHCPECRLADMTRWERRRYEKAQSKNPLRFYGGSMRWMFGPEKSMYEQHRDAWLQTGDVMELDRMKRHVSLYS
jgi:hypothetical protein